MVDFWKDQTIRIIHVNSDSATYSATLDTRFRWLRLNIFLDLGNLIKLTCYSVPEISRRFILNPSNSGFNVIDRSYTFLAACCTPRRQEQGKTCTVSRLKTFMGTSFF